MSQASLDQGLLDRALRRVTALWRDRAAVPEEDIAAQMQACLDGRGGEVSARQRAARLAEAWMARDGALRIGFLRTLAGFDADDAKLQLAIAALRRAIDPGARAAAMAQLRRALDPPRRRLLMHLATIPDGVRLLVELRAELLGAMAGDPLLQALEADVQALLATWFDIGFLELRRIDWNSPAALLEKLVQYEAVHRIRTWRDLKNRLDHDRRCYAFFHPRMPEEPLIFVEVALVEGLASSVQRLLDEKAPVQDPCAADTAIFYSINNCQRGLDGISFGNFLIKRVVALLGEELPNLAQFATLSPIPGFARWLGERLGQAPPAVTEAEAATLRAVAPAEASLPAPASGGAAAALMPPEAPEATLQRLLARRGWWRDAPVARALEPVLVRLCADYLLQAASARAPTRARDPVAHFHLSNGARIERLNWLGDVSDKGLRESAGLMVNYLYDPARIEAHHEAYAGEGRRPASPALRRLLRG